MATTPNTEDIINLSSPTSFQHRLGEESLDKHAEITHPAATLQTASSQLKRPALLPRWSTAQSSFLSSSSSPEFDELSRLSSVTDIRSLNAVSAPLSPSTPPVDSDDLFKVTEEAESDQADPSPLVPGGEQSNSGRKRTQPLSVLEEDQAINVIKPTQQPTTLDLNKPTILSPVDEVGRRHRQTASEDSINVVEPDQRLRDTAVVAVAPPRGPADFSSPIEFYEAAAQGRVECVTTATPKVRPDVTDEKLRDSGRKRVRIQKHAAQAAQITVNGLFIFITWWWMRYYWILLPFIMATVALNVVMIVSIILRQTKNLVLPEKKVVPETPESMVMLVPCYNETKEELTRSLDCLVTQEGIDQHKRAILIVCDGKVRGPGMAKSTAHYLLDDILTNKTERKNIRGAYLAWDQQFMDIICQTGTYGGIPYMCIVKQQNQGKRDSLILARSFLYKFNLRAELPTTIMTSRLFGQMTKFLLQAGIESVDCIIGMDADTMFESQCIKELVEESHYDKTVGVCGYVMVDFSAGWSLWGLYQSAEYTIAQGLRRLHQSLVTKKVSCLPGCCQLLKIVEETCGDEVLIDKFGYCPTVKDGLLTHVRATASEDRNHVCHMLSARPKVETRQALRARAITDVPHSWSVFLSQRRRWTLGATSNDLLLVFAPGVQWFERILALVNVFTWYLSPFIIASLVSFIWACFHAPVWILMAFVSVMLVPIVYYLCIPLWITGSWKERIQFWLGGLMYVFCGPFICIAVLCYALWNADSFGWGKTRKVVSTDAADNEDENVNLSETASETSEKVVKVSQPEVPDRMRELADAEKRMGIQD